MWFGVCKTPATRKIKKLYRKEYRPKIGFLQTFMFPYSRHFKTDLNYIRQIPKGDVLDVGSSEGKFLYLLKLRGWKVLGIEPTSHYVEFANRVLKVPTINGLFEEVELEKIRPCHN